MGLFDRIKRALSGDDASPPDDDLLDGCELDFTEDPLPDEDADLFVLFAQGLDPNDPKTVEEAEAEWREVFPNDGN